MAAVGRVHRGLLAALLVGAAQAPAAEPPAAAPNRWVTGYYVGYQLDDCPVDAVEVTALTHLAVGRVLPRADGTLDTAFDLDAARGPALARALAARAHAAGRRALLMVGGAGTRAGWVGGASDARRSAFVRNLIEKVRTLGFDGLDLDWEPMEREDRPSFAALAGDLRRAAPQLVLTWPVGWVNTNRVRRVDRWYADVAPLFDQVNVMTYGMADAWGWWWTTWHSSALQGASMFHPTSVASSLEAYAAAGVARSKLGVGVGFFGTCWGLPATGPSQLAPGARVRAGDNIMTDAKRRRWYDEPSARRWDRDASAPYLSFPEPRGPERCTFISYEDERSILAKGAWARAHGYGGAIIWTVNQGYIPELRRSPLLEAVRDAFLRP